MDRVVSVEDPACLLRDFDQQWRDERTRERMLKVAELLESELSVVGTSAHMLALARKPYICAALSNISVLPTATHR